MPDIRRENRVHRANRILAEIPDLTSWQRRCLSVPLTEPGRHVLIATSSSRPQRPRAFVVGPAGVHALVIVEATPDWIQLARVRKYAEEVCARAVFDSTHFVPHMVEVLAVLPTASTSLLYDRFPVTDEAGLRGLLKRSERRLSARKADDVASALAAGLSAYRWIHSVDLAPARTVPAIDGLFDADEVRADARERILARPFQEWMTFLDPEQLGTVHTNYTGPARISGPAGTGKSIVALHRMARFAKHHPGRMLFTSFVKTLPRYHESAFALLAPYAIQRAEFIGLHAWVVNFLKRREVRFDLDDTAVRNCFNLTWAQARSHLGTIEHTDVQYWIDEVDRVIKGRGLSTCRQYLDVGRTGREGVSLRRRTREFIWNNLYLPYQARLENRGIDDFNDIVRKALDELRARPLDTSEGYGLVVVDEVQDFTLLQLQLVHRIAGGGPHAPLLLVGDGQQQVYAGGWRLSDAGIPLPGGRGRVLRTNYRNREAILEYTRQIDAGNTVDDLDGGPGFVLRDSTAVLPGGRVVTKRPGRSDVEAELLRALHEYRQPGSDIAVIAGSNRDVTRLMTVLARAGFPVLALEKYNGTQLEPIKVGTVHRAKGMDFEAVFVIGNDSGPLGELSGGARDRAELRARQRLVAASRPRDFLWVAHTLDVDEGG